MPALVPPKRVPCCQAPPNRVFSPQSHHHPQSTCTDTPCACPRTPQKGPMLPDQAPPQFITPNLPVGAGLVPALVPPKRVPCCQTRHPPKSRHHPQFTRRGRPCACPRTTQKGPMLSDQAPPNRVFSPNRIITPNQPALTRLVPALVPPKRVPCCQTRHPPNRVLSPKTRHHPQFTRRDRPCACPRTTQKGPMLSDQAPPKRVITPVIYP